MFVFVLAFGKLKTSLSSRKASSASLFVSFRVSLPVMVLLTVLSAFNVHPGFFAGSKTAVPVVPSAFSYVGNVSVIVIVFAARVCAFPFPQF